MDHHADGILVTTEVASLRSNNYVIDDRVEPIMLEPQTHHASLTRGYLVHYASLLTASGRGSYEKIRVEGRTFLISVAGACLIP